MGVRHVNVVLVVPTTDHGLNPPGDPLIFSVLDNAYVIFIDWLYHPNVLVPVYGCNHYAWRIMSTKGLLIDPTYLSLRIALSFQEYST